MAIPQHTLSNLARLSHHTSDLANFIRRRFIEYKVQHGDYLPEEASSLCGEYQKAGGDPEAFARMVGWPDG